TLQTPQTYPTDGGTMGLVAADFNGDGVMDLAAVNSTASDFSVFLGVAPKWNVTIAPNGPVTQTGAKYVVTVNNVGTGPSAGPVTANISFPLGGISLADISGAPDWTCTLATLSCQTSTARPAGTAYSPITMTGLFVAPAFGVAAGGTVSPS